MQWHDQAKRVDFHEMESKENYMMSHLGAEVFNAATDRYEAESFVIRSPSEHTVMGKYLDIELQIKHNA